LLHFRIKRRKAMSAEKPDPAASLPPPKETKKGEKPGLAMTNSIQHFELL